MTGPKFDTTYIRNSILQSRERLRREQIDVMLLHLNGLSIEEAKPVFDTLEDLRIQGQVASFGWSTDFWDNLDAVASRPGFNAVQHSMNIFFDAPSLSAIAKVHDLIQFNRSPLAMGVLTGKFSNSQRIGMDDVRRNDADWQGYFNDGVALPKYINKLEAVRDLITVGGRTLAQGALCWLLAKSPRTLPLPGAKSAKQAEENSKAIDYGPLPDSIMVEIEAVLKRPPEGPPRAR